MNYQGRPEYYNTVKTAKTRIEASYELSMRKNGRTTDIFALKNFGWRDTQEIQGEFTQAVVVYRPEKLTEDAI